MSLRATSIRLLVVGVVVSSASPAHADAGAVAAACVVADTTAPQPGTELFDAPSGGRAVAKFPGAALPLRVSLSSGVVARVRVETGGARPALRISGWGNAAAFRFFARESVALIPGHAWLAKGLELRPVAVKDGQIEFEHGLYGTRAADGQRQKLRGVLPCGSVAMSPPSIEPAEAPRGARWYHMKNASLVLHDAPKGAPVLELAMDDDSRRVLWGGEVRAGWVHVTSPGDVTLDGWVRMTDLEAHLRREFFDMEALAPPPLEVRSVALEDARPPVTSMAPSTVALEPREGAVTLGRLDAGAPVLVMTRAREWANVLPADLAILPADGLGFWITSSALPAP